MNLRPITSPPKWEELLCSLWSAAHQRADGTLWINQVAREANGAESTGRGVLVTCKTAGKRERSLKGRRRREGQQRPRWPVWWLSPGGLGSGRSQGGAGSSVAVPAAWVAHKVAGQEQRSSRHRPLS